MRWFKPSIFARMIMTAFVIMLGTLVVMGQTGTLPIVYIETDGHRAITSKEYYIPGTYYLVDYQEPDMNIGSAENPMALEIKGRGHSSWKGTKKPYKIKLGEKAPLLGMNANKHWALLKFNEPTIAGFRLGNIMGMDWTPSARPVEVVLNGDYQGIYFLTETNRIGKNRLDIYEQPDLNDDEGSIPYGWLVEVDNYYEKNQISISENNMWPLRITYHSPEALSSGQRTWLTEEFQRINDAVYNPDKDHSTWEQYIDVDAMARYFIIQEVLDNSDGFHGSFYLHKDWTDDARWVAGPLWDLSCNQRVKTDYTFRMKTSYNFIPHWIGELIKDDDFGAAVVNAWHEFYPDEVQPWMNYIDEHLLPCSEAFEQEKIRWNWTDQQTIAERVTRLKNSLLNNIEWFNNHLPTSGIGSVVVNKEIVKVEYVNMAGMRSSSPWNGVNIKVTTYNDGSISTTKIVKN
jgi:hypothetical protein